MARQGVRMLPCRSLPISRRRRVSAFSLIEILVVIAIIGILLAVVFRGGSTLVRNAKTRDTEALLKKLDLAIDEFKREADLSKIPNAKALFNGAPPDDLRVFDASSATYSVVGGCPVRFSSNGVFKRNETIVKVADLIDDRGGDGTLKSTAKLVHADIRAMVLSMRLYSPRARAILDSIDPKYWADTEAVDGYVYYPDASDTSSFVQLDFLVDAWGNPLEYYSTCRCQMGITLPPREETSNTFVHYNNDGPVIVSYGADGADQFSADMMAAEGDTSMVADYYAESNNGANAGIINSPFNSDNVYSSDFFANRVRNQAGE